MGNLSTWIFLKHFPWLKLALFKNFELFFHKLPIGLEAMI
ncbi:hypothetical protein SLEP1_g24541 [Rubroshorea leprosula]|uniref:Uncharacterized protein n=1 Tax=Rubroshorea leprosula TaxID=152421 RepID=A0AAV5JS42_9ROSI|nr:hypothetical protein SLEP1_g24541 [Rubroshorea leprosula]